MLYLENGFNVTAFARFLVKTLSLSPDYFRKSAFVICWTLYIPTYRNPSWLASSQKALFYLGTKSGLFKRPKVPSGHF